MNGEYFIRFVLWKEKLQGVLRLKTPFFNLFGSVLMCP